MAVKTPKTKPRRDRYYIVDYKKLELPVLMRYDFKTHDLAYQAITEHLANDIKRYNVIHGADARKHKIKFGKRKDDGRIWPDRKYNYPVGESLTPRQKQNFRNKQNQRKYIENRKRRENEHITEKNTSYIESDGRWRNLEHSRRLARHRANKPSPE